MKIQNEEAVSPGKTVTTEDAVSPVIGVILMVAITVILAAVIAAFVFGLAGTTSTTRTVGMTVALNQSVDEGFVITFTGGSDLSSLSDLIINYDGAAETLALETADPGTIVIGRDIIDVVAGPDGTTVNKISLTGNNKFNVGNLLSVVNADTTFDVSGKRITIIGVFTDGGTQILYDRTL